MTATLDNLLFYPETTGGHKCAQCGAFVPVGAFHCCSVPGVSATLTGWKCPKCGNVYSPFVVECTRCNKK